jgi:hypothetical protein
MSDDKEVNDVEDEDIKRLMKDHLVDEETAEKAQELIDEGLDEDEAVELADEL